jgi:GxxExxY protein
MNDQSGHDDEVSEELNVLTSAVIGAAIEVHRLLGPGLLESVYEEALCIELKLRGIPFVRQAVVPVRYKGHAAGEMRLDLLVRDVLIVELKAVDELAQVHSAQLLSYLRLTGSKLGLLINFNVPILKNGIKRLALSRPNRDV